MKDDPLRFSSFLTFGLFGLFQVCLVCFRCVWFVSGVFLHWNPCSDSASEHCSYPWWAGEGHLAARVRKADAATEGADFTDFK